MKTINRNARKRPEDALQSQIVSFARSNFDRREWRLFHVPNGGQRTKAEAGRFVALGVSSGVPDLVLVGPEGFVGWIEVKAPKGVTSGPQDDWAEFLSATGHRYGLVRSLDEFRALLVEWGAPVRIRI